MPHRNSAKNFGNIFGRRIARIEADLEGFARDLRDLLAGAGDVAGDAAGEAT